MKSANQLEAQTQPESSSTSTSSSSCEESNKWGTHVMGPPEAPAVHPASQQAALWSAAHHHHPYVQYSAVYNPKPTQNPLEPLIRMFNSWATKAETIACNVWHNLKIGPSVTEAAWGKVNLTAKAITEGGFESLFRQTFASDPNEKLKQTFACYISSSTGPVAGTLYLSTARVAFCSDRPLSVTAPSGQESWYYYKVVIPLANIGTVNPRTARGNLADKYLHLVTTDGHEFWFVGFVHFNEATHHILSSVSDFKAAQTVAD